MNTQIHISGAGSIGLLLAYHLTKACKQVTLITRRNQNDKQVINYSKETLRDSIIVSTTTAPLVQKIDTLIICTKVFDSKQAGLDLLHAIDKNTAIILLHNGMGVHDEVIKALPDNKVYAALTTEAAKRIGPYSIMHTGSGITKIASLQGECMSHTLIHKLACEIKIIESLNIKRDIWRKFTINCCINPLTVIHDCLNGELLQNQGALETADAIIEECKQLARHQGVGAYLEGIEADCRAVMKQTAANSSSMREDIINHKPSEIDYLNGYIIRESEILGLPTPINQQIYTKIKATIDIATPL